ncbi:hypothetical protein ABKV19_006137 [Rosa sericea]
MSESQTPCTKSRKRKRNAHVARVLVLNPDALPKLGNLLYQRDMVTFLWQHACLDKNGSYLPRFSDRVAYMSLRCGMNGDHWDPFCPNSINDPPDSGEAAPARKSLWKYILRNFNLKEYLDKKIKTQGKPEPPRKKAVKSKAPACPIHCQN